MTFIAKLISSTKLGATKSAILLLMIASLSCGVLAIFLSFVAGISVIIALPGLVVAAFFAYRYTMYDRIKGRGRKEEEHRRGKKRHNR
jgi:4-hydroxybenzoate polyprenyltransferase